MTIKLNGTILDYTLEDEKTAGEVLAKLELACKAESAAITQVCVDGKTLLPEDLDKFFMKPADCGVSVEVTAITGGEIREMIKKSAGNLEIFSQHLEQIPVKLQTGKDYEVLQLVQDFSIELANLYSKIGFFDIAGISLDEKFSGKTIPEYQAELSPLLKAVLMGLENKDTVEVSDIAEYELSPLVRDLGKGLLSMVCSK